MCLAPLTAICVNTVDTATGYGEYFANFNQKALKQTMSLKLIIFDLDGTIYKSESTFVPSIMNAMKDFDLAQLSPGDILPLLRYTAWGYSENILGSDDADRVDAFRKKVRFYELQGIREAGVLFPGVVNVLSELKGLGCEMVICTNAENNYLTAVVEKTGIGNFFTAMIGNESGRPKADLVRELIASTGHSAEQCVIVGDSDSDQTAALQNDILFIEAAWGYGNASIENALYRIRHISELPGMIKGLQDR